MRPKPYDFESYPLTTLARCLIYRSVLTRVTESLAWIHVMALPTIA
jgi:hypothetical protein